jgi:hypothetical protein
MLAAETKLQGRDAIDAAQRREIKTTNFTAEINGRYTTNGTGIVVTDATGTGAGQVYSVLCGSGTVVIGGVTYSPSRMEIVRYYNGSTWVTLAPTISDNLILNGTHNTAQYQSGVMPDPHDLLNLNQVQAQYIETLTCRLRPLSQCELITSSAGGGAVRLEQYGWGLDIYSGTQVNGGGFGGGNFGNIYPGLILAFSRKFMFQFQITGGGVSADARVYVTFGLSGTALTNIPAASDKGFGIRTTASNTKVVCYVMNGSSLVEGSEITLPGSAQVTNQCHNFRVINSNGSVTFWFQKDCSGAWVLLDTLTAPTGSTSGQYTNTIIAQAKCSVMVGTPASARAWIRNVWAYLE